MSSEIQYQLRVLFIHYQLFIVVYVCHKRGVLGPGSGNNHKHTLCNNSFYLNSVLSHEYNLIILTAILQRMQRYLYPHVLPNR